MRKIVTPLLIGAIAGILATCSTDSIGPIEDLPRALSVAERQLIEADNRFAFGLFVQVNRQEGDKNIFISPLSVAMALGMTYNGAAGTTREAMQQVLELQGMDLQEVNESYRSLIELLRDLDPAVRFMIANSIWYRNTLTFEQEFLDLNRQYFDAEVSALDFGDPGSVDVINSWVQENTMDKIDRIVEPPIDPLTIMFLINAIYFKGDWTQQFDKDLTEDAPFTLKDGSLATVDMMSHDEEVPIRYAVDGDLQIVDLAYGGRAYSMTIVLPASAQDIDTVVAGLNQTQWNGWIAALDSTSRYISLPKFKLEYELSLNDVLKAMGMEIAFSDIADFTEMYGPGGAYISKVKHKTFVDVNEEGTEAAAVTSVEISLTSIGPMPIVVDRPFLFAIRENLSGAILFMGKIVDPSAG
ncbi:MAG: serpin family protein [Gemmatimonadota bacterium]|nr:MAG: serpin family protein [Gemmatimonadota bacterium]